MNMFRMDPRDPDAPAPNPPEGREGVRLFHRPRAEAEAPAEEAAEAIPGLSALFDQQEAEAQEAAGQAPEAEQIETDEPAWDAPEWDGGDWEAAPAAAADEDVDEISLRVTPPAETARKPRLAFMGEFSAGKSTLTNMLIGASPLPVKVTATKLPPVWVSYGDEAPYCEDFEGNRHPVDLDRLHEIDPHEVQVIRIFHKADVLELCDMIDMPGISDPNMPAELWQPIANQADMVVWCTHATQAWRQSEAAAWASVDPMLFERSLLLLTRFDKLLSERDGARVLRRVRYEAEGYFADCFPISLTAALAAGDDHDRWQASGAEAFMEALVEQLNALTVALGGEQRGGMSRLHHGASAGAETAQEAAGALAAAPDAPRVLPRRVQLSGAGAPRRARPEFSEPPADADARLQP